MSTAKEEEYRWFAPSDRGVPVERFADVTLEIDVSDVTVTEALPPVIPQPHLRTNTPLPEGATRDPKFAELNTIVRELREVLLKKWEMLPAQVDAVEWQLRQRLAELKA